MPQVVRREYKSSEDHFNSIQRRKRSAISLADPMDLKSQRGGGVATLEESSEFTRCLTPEEVMNLNQQRSSITSPSERMRLFSFSRRRLKLPFSKSKGKKEKDLRDRLVSPDKEHSLSASGASSSPDAHAPTKHHHHHQRRGSPTTTKTSHSQDRTDST